MGPWLLTEQVRWTSKSGATSAVIDLYCDFFEHKAEAAGQSLVRPFNRGYSLRLCEQTVAGYCSTLAISTNLEDTGHPRDGNLPVLDNVNGQSFIVLGEFAPATKLNPAPVGRARPAMVRFGTT
jgi:hypothetical protein